MGFRFSLNFRVRTLRVLAIRLLFAYAFGRPESEQNSSLQGAAVEVLRFSSLVTAWTNFSAHAVCHVIGGDSDTSASIKRCETRTIRLGGMPRRFIASSVCRHGGP